MRKPRIHAALEDGALDLLYPSARDELRDVMEIDAGQTPEQAAYALHAEFYRFLDHSGAVMQAPNVPDVGSLAKSEEAQLALTKLPDRQQIGYLFRQPGNGAGVISEVIAIGPGFSPTLMGGSTLCLTRFTGLTEELRALVTYAIVLSGVIAMLIVVGQAWPMGMGRRAVSVAVLIGTTMPSWSRLEPRSRT